MCPKKRADGPSPPPPPTSPPPPPAGGLKISDEVLAKTQSQTRIIIDEERGTTSVQTNNIKEGTGVRVTYDLNGRIIDTKRK